MPKKVYILNACVLLYLKFQGVLDHQVQLYQTYLGPDWEGDRSKEWEKTKTRFTLHTRCLWLHPSRRRDSFFQICAKLSYKVMVALVEFQVIQSLGKPEGWTHCDVTRRIKVPNWHFRVGKGGENRRQAVASDLVAKEILSMPRVNGGFLSNFSSFSSPYFLVFFFFFEVLHDWAHTQIFYLLSSLFFLFASNKYLASLCYAPGTIVSSTGHRMLKR